METVTPTFADLPEKLREAAAQIGARLARDRHRCWVVGGAVRDLAIGRTPVDVDLTTDANPDEVEACFPQTVPLGKRFGTVLVKWSGLGVEVTSLRSESGYEDARRPDSVEFGTSVDKDARRRDFTCNAMYLDTQSGEFLDPVRGIADLGSGLLRAVGEPSTRFAEDGLRIFRLARLAAELNLAPEAETLQGARSSLESLRGVSAERILAELEKGFACIAGPVMIRLLEEIGVHGRLFPSATRGAGGDAASIAAHLPQPMRLAMGLLLFVDPNPLGAAPRSERSAQVLSALKAQRPSRQIRRESASIWSLCCELEAYASEDVDQGQLRLWMREEAWEGALQLALACSLTRGESGSRWREWQAERSLLTREELFPAPWVEAGLLRELGCEPGPAWKVWMAEGLRLQLDGAWKSPSDARAWLRAELDA